jgi:signal transduction histidine kinase
MSWQLPAAALLVVLLATMATLQYRWLGEVSRAEEERMRASLRTRATDLAREFDRELTRTYIAFRLEPEASAKDPAAAIAAAYDRWRSSSPAPAMLRGLYVIDGATFESGALRRFNPDRRTLDAAEWPADLAASLKRSDRLLPHVVGNASMLTADAVDARAMALVVPVPQVSPNVPGHPMTVIADPSAPVRAVIVQLDADAVRRQMIQPLVAKYFGEGDTSDYLVTIARSDDPSATIYDSAAGSVSVGAAEVTTGLFDLSLDQMNRFAVAAALPPTGGSGSVKTEHMAITIVRRAGPGDAARVLSVDGGLSGWQLRARHRSGSLAAIVEASRRRNLAISLGVLVLLAASFVLIVAAAQRQRRLSQQQMEFVASVSHELRTPIAVIRSAGENLMDGVISDAVQVKTYGALIETEGRRLGDMVERVMEFAGINSGARTRAHAPVDLNQVIADAVRGASMEARERGVTVSVRPGGALPETRGDADALRSAVQNVVANAVKYSAVGGVVDVSAEASDERFMTIRVTDRGIGIDADDLPHLFKPFFRGRRAVDAQVRGTGVGLSVVGHVVQMHGGDVRVESTVGEGTTVTIVLPVQTSTGASAGRIVRLRPGAAS